VASLRWLPSFVSIGAALLSACHESAPPSTVVAPGAEHEQRVVDDAAYAVSRMRGDARFVALDGYLKNARGVLVFPRLIKASFVFGGEGGSGVLVGRAPDGTFSAPAFYGIGSGSFGPQIGYREASVVLVLMNDGALSAVLRSGLTLGADVSAVLGNDTGEARASTSTKDVVAFVDAEGAFAGASIAGVVVEPRPALNRAYYGVEVAPREIVVDRRFDQVGAAVLRAALGAALQVALPPTGAVVSPPGVSATGAGAPPAGASATSAGTPPRGVSATSAGTPPPGASATGAGAAPAGASATGAPPGASATGAGAAPAGASATGAPPGACKDKKTLGDYAGECVPAH